MSENLPDYDDACNLFNTESENHTQLSIAQRTRELQAVFNFILKGKILKLSY